MEGAHLGIQDQRSDGFTLLGLSSAGRPPQLPKKQDQRSRKFPLPRVRALFLLLFGLLMAFCGALDYIRQRKPDSLGGIPQEVLVFKEAERRVENGDTRAWTSPSTEVLAIPFQKLTSVQGKWTGSYGVVWVQTGGDLGGNHRCIADEIVPDWGKEITLDKHGPYEFEPECSVELPITEAHVHRTFNVTARMEVTYPVLTSAPVVMSRRAGEDEIAPGLWFLNAAKEVSREFQLFVASTDEAKRMHHFKNQQTSSPLGPINIDVVFSLLSLGALGGAVLLRR